MPYRRTEKTQARLDSQRGEILAAAIALLAETGYAGCSMAAVAAQAGVGTGSVYRQFPSKADLVVEVFREVVSREVAAVEAAASHGDVRERVVAVIETFAGRALKAPRLAYALLAEPVDAVVEAERLVFRRAFREVIARNIADGVTRGLLPSQDAEATAAALVGAGAEMLVGPLAGDGGPDTIPHLVTFTLRALGGSDGV
ncbi:TetR/AcrR family transcriptional regulator [Amycolatopsis sp. BJA-103]|uniref:TetR/AcrR family transcriptional regulator n=1 Tax=unclassified Amycolatopsis TaxID=2618356 RepID=UPI000C785A8D|nr:TetR/AcrR family transcriptional regulator [Amycolatopsis sp. BJA-103]AUI64680.1 TetR family transcriptional regulator [Amycolatopsis sp. BJA-103]PNE22202.1 TetR family transcriptional regulator [Amycolatopsis sp. BJA-103]